MTPNRIHADTETGRLPTPDPVDPASEKTPTQCVEASKDRVLAAVKATWDRYEAAYRYLGR